MPSAGGEVIYGAKGFLPYINAGCVDIVMPDVKYCGGMLELKKIASLAEAAGPAGRAARSRESGGECRGGARLRGHAEFFDPGIFVRRSAVAR